MHLCKKPRKMVKSNGEFYFVCGCGKAEREKKEHRLLRDSRKEAKNATRED